VITLDTNIYVSALQYGGKPMALLQQALSGDIEISVSQAILDETLRVLREKFHWTAEDLDSARSLILSVARMVEPQRTLDVVHDDPTDNRILECAAEAGADCILSGDRHLLKLGEYAGIRIIRVSDFLQTGIG
jgi:putative PIN family toxin of toxin-antitoxin system